MNIIINEETRLELTVESHAAGLFGAINTNRQHLSEFLPWVGYMQATEDVRAYLKNCEVLYTEQKEISFVIFHNNTVVGRIGIHYINQMNKSGAIGYWLTKDAEGKGIITKSCIAIINHGFKELGLNRIELKAAVKNFRSQAVPERLGFIKEGTLRQAERVNDEFLDLQLYAMLREDWKG
jgi:ribosomal-protein-serine acetyltransferase